MMDINQASLNKRWFGYKTACGTSAEFALLVNYKCRSQGGVKAFVYQTGDVFEGAAVDVLSNISSVLNAEYSQKLGSLPPHKERAFYTQSWQGETRALADGDLFYVPPWQI